MRRGRVGRYRSVRRQTSSTYSQPSTALSAFGLSRGPVRVRGSEPLWMRLVPGRGLVAVGQPASMSRVSPRGRQIEKGGPAAETSCSSMKTRMS